MSEAPAKPPLIPYLLGFALALTCALWAGTHFALTGSSIGYGALTGLSFGAMFAFGQRVKQRLFPKPAPTKWKVAAVPAGAPSGAKLRPAQRALANAKPLSVEFDDERIRTRRGDEDRDSLAWADIERIAITIGTTSGGEGLPMPHWLIGSAQGGLRLANDCIGLEALTEQFRAQLPGYDNDATYQAVINAMGAIEGTFEIWRKPAATAS